MQPGSSAEDDSTTNSSSCVDTTTTSSSNAAEPACILDVLLPDTIIQILKLLRHTPACIASFSLSCSQAYALCSDAALWAGLCRAITDALPRAFAGVDWSPAAWGVGSHRELYACLLQPYAPLLQQRMWHTSKMPAGQLLVIEAQPPSLVARSVFYRTLQGPPFSHPVFVVQLPKDRQGKAQVHCFSCQRNPVLEEVNAAYAALSNSPLSTSTSTSSPSDVLQAASGLPAQLQFTATPDAAIPDEAAAAAAGTTPRRQAVHAGRNSVAAGTLQGTSFTFRCRATCGGLYAEQMARWHTGRPYLTAATEAAVPAGSASSCDLTFSSQLSQPSPSSPGSSSSAAAGGGSGGNDSSSSSSLLPLPDVEAFTYRLSNWDLRFFVEDMNIPAGWRSNADYVPFQVSSWLWPAPDSLAAAAAAAELQSHHRAAVCPSRLGAAAALPGLWRGTYGAHGVELVQLQLLQAPPGYDMFLQHPLPQLPPISVDDCGPGVLLQAVLPRAGVAVHPGLFAATTTGMDESDESVGEDGGSDGSEDEAVGDLEGLLLGGAVASSAAAAGSGAGEDAVGSLQAGGPGVLPAAAAGAAAVLGAGVSGAQQQQQAQRAGPPPAAPQQLLLVATKVTGDRNVPAGHVTFAVDLASRSTEGAGQPLQVPPGVHSAVDLDAAGTQPLVVKECYSGLAQIAEAYYQSPRISAVTLLLFERTDPACFGVLWAAPMDTFSFFVRQSTLP